MSAATYWHELPSTERLQILNSGIGLGALVARYAQPAWCRYPEALAGSYGCWSLMDCAKTLVEVDCLDCDLYKDPQRSL